MLLLQNRAKPILIYNIFYVIGDKSLLYCAFWAWTFRETKCSVLFLPSTVLFDVPYPAFTRMCFEQNKHKNLYKIHKKKYSEFISKPLPEKALDHSNVQPSWTTSTQYDIFIPSVISTRTCYFFYLDDVLNVCIQCAHVRKSWLPDHFLTRIFVSWDMCNKNMHNIHKVNLVFFDDRRAMIRPPICLTPWSKTTTWAGFSVEDCIRFGTPPTQSLGRQHMIFQKVFAYNEHNMYITILIPRRRSHITTVENMFILLYYMKWQFGFNASCSLF